MPHRHRAVLLTLLLSPLPAASDTSMTAGNLLSVCTTADMHWIDFCNGFFQAANDQAAVASRACVPPGTSRTALVELYELQAGALLEAEPGLADMPGVALAIEILAAAYPCQ